MSVTSETNPILAVIDILDASAAADWSNANGKPERIDRDGEYSMSDKRAYEGDDAVYVGRADGGGVIEPLDATGDKRQETFEITCEAWTLTGDIADINQDLISILSDYWTDNKTTTPFVTVRPFNTRDLSEQSWGDHGQHDRGLVSGRLMRSVTI